MAAGAGEARQGWEGVAEDWPAPLTVGVVADTHIHAEPAGRDLPAVLLDELARAQVGLILHAGDIFAPRVLDRLAELAPVLAVTGNGDYGELRAALPASRVVTVGPHRLGLVHGHAGRGGTTPLRAVNTFGPGGAGAAGPPVGCVVFGHSHQPLARRHEPGGIILFNPGSPTDKRAQPYFSFGLLRIAATIEPELVQFP